MRSHVYSFTSGDIAALAAGRAAPLATVRVQNSEWAAAGAGAAEPEAAPAVAASTAGDASGGVTSAGLAAPHTTLHLRDISFISLPGINPGAELQVEVEWGDVWQSGQHWEGTQVEEEMHFVIAVIVVPRHEGEAAADAAAAK